MDFRKWRIYAVVAVVTPDILRRTREEIEYRLDICKSTNDAHIEIYSGCQKILRFSSGPLFHVSRVTESLEDFRRP
jgi:hypothetical protein